LGFPLFRVARTFSWYYISRVPIESFLAPFRKKIRPCSFPLSFWYKINVTPPPPLPACNPPCSLTLFEASNLPISVPTTLVRVSLSRPSLPSPRQPDEILGLHPSDRQYPLSQGLLRSLGILLRNRRCFPETKSDQKHPTETGQPEVKGTLPLFQDNLLDSALNPPNANGLLLFFSPLVSPLKALNSAVRLENPLLLKTVSS